MNDRPNAAELVAATKQFLEGELIPTLADARLRFQTLVAANVLAIVERELLSEEGHLLEEWNGLAQLLGDAGPVPQRLAALKQGIRDANAELCRRIRAGEFDNEDRFRMLARQLRRGVAAKLAVANPKYLAHASAR